MKYATLFFDLDKTLWDYSANSQKSLSILYKKYKLNAYYLSFEEFFISYNKINDMMWDAYRQGNVKKEDLRLKRFSLTLQEKGINDEKLAEEFGEEYMDITPKLNILTPNAIETLDYLKDKGYKMYILTNGFLKTQETKLKHGNLEPYFKKIFSSDVFGINKPHKEIFHWAVSSVHAQKDKCLMIGDDLPVDIIGAKNYGIDGVWYNPEKIEADFKPTYNIRNLGELKSIL